MLAKTGLKLLQVMVMAIKYKMAFLSGKFTAINSVKLRGNVVSGDQEESTACRVK